MFGESGHAVADELSADPIARREPLIRNDPMVNDVPARRDSQIRRAPNGTGLYDVLDLVLDKGIVIDAFVRVSLVGIELLTVDLRVVIASVDTYLRYAEGVERLGVYKSSNPTKLPDMVKGGMKGHALKQGAEKLLGGSGNDDDEEEGDGESEQGEGVAGKLAQGVRNVMRRGVRGIVGRLAGDDDGGEQGGDDEADERDDAHGRQPHGSRHHLLHHEQPSKRSAGNGHGGRNGGGAGGRST